MLLKSNIINFSIDSLLQAQTLRALKVLSPYHVLDTHKADFYKHPTAKIDVALSDSATVRPRPPPLTILKVTSHLVAPFPFRL